MSIDLITLAETVESLASTCNRCGMCQAVCPVYKTTGLESDSARGKLALMSALHESITDSPRETFKRLERCTLCGGCQAACPRGVATVDAFLLARKALAEAAHLSGAKRVLLRQAFADPKRTATLAARFAAVQRRFVTQGDGRVAMVGKYPVPKVRRPFLKERNLNSLEEGGGPKVLLFSGCLVDKAYPFVGEGLVGLLREAGARVVIPEGQGCCGIPLLTGGDTEAFNGVVKAHLELFGGEDVDYVVTPCATCTHALKALWPKACDELSDDDANCARSIAAKVMDGADLLVLLGEGAPPEESPSDDATPLVVTVHDPCHGRHSLKNTEEVRTLITRAGHTLVEMEPGCCGLGGSFGVSHRDLSLSVGESCLARIEATGADVVVTTCPGCMAQIEALLTGSGSSMRVRHAVELLAHSQ